MFTLLIYPAPSSRLTRLALIRSRLELSNQILAARHVLIVAAQRLALVIAVRALVTRRINISTVPTAALTVFVSP